jgi:uncharacterized membrane protein
MLEHLISYQWVFVIIVIGNFLLFVYVLGPRVEKEDQTAATKFLLYIIFVLSILSFLYGIYLCITLIPEVGTYTGSSVTRTFKGNLFRFLIPIFVLGFNGYLAYLCYPMIKYFESRKK